MTVCKHGKVGLILYEVSDYIYPLLSNPLVILITQTLLSLEKCIRRHFDIPEHCKQ